MRLSRHSQLGILCSPGTASYPSWIASRVAGAIPARFRPLMRKSAATDTGGTDLAVYRDQLEEIQRDRAAGQIGLDPATGQPAATIRG